MFGFMSTSKNLQRAQEFTDRDGYIFVIHIPELEIRSETAHLRMGKRNNRLYKEVRAT